MDSHTLQIIMQLITSMESVSAKLEKAYGQRNNEELDRAKKEMITLQSKIASLLG